MPYCVKCGKQLVKDARFCPACGYPVNVSYPVNRSIQGQPSQRQLVCCPKCGSTDISIQTFQENIQSVTAGGSTVDIREKRHGFFWWIFIGWWWMIIKGILWIVAFIPMAIIRAGRKKKYVGTVQTVTTTKNNIRYRVLCTCQRCGNTWDK